MKNNPSYSKSEKTKQFIIRQVAPIFNQKGYAGTSLSDLTAATGLTKGSIYGNFKNKDEVAIEAFKFNTAFIGRSLQDIIEKGESPLDKLRTLPDFYRNIFPHLISIGGCPILNTAVDADDTHPQLKSMAQKAVNNLNSVFISLVNDGIACKQIKQDTNADKFAKTVLLVLEGGLLMAKLNNDYSYFENAMLLIQKMIEEITI